MQSLDIEKNNYNPVTYQIAKISNYVTSIISEKGNRIDLDTVNCVTTFYVKLLKMNFHYFQFAYHYFKFAKKNEKMPQLYLKIIDVYLKVRI